MTFEVTPFTWGLLGITCFFALLTWYAAKHRATEPNERDKKLLETKKEILRLQFELRKVEQERDALSRAAAHFAGQLARQEAHETQRG